MLPVTVTVYVEEEEDVPPPPGPLPALEETPQPMGTINSSIRQEMRARHLRLRLPKIPKGTSSARARLICFQRDAEA